MALQGNLGHLGLADVLQTALSGTGGGNLTLVHGADRAVLHVAEDGLYLLEPEVIDAEDLLRAFRDRGLLTADALKQARAKGLTDVSLIDLLVNEGALPHSDLSEIVAGAAEDTILDLLTWNEGTFRFEEHASLPARPGLVGRVPVDRNGVLLRAAQRLDERQGIVAVVGLKAHLFQRGEAPVPTPEEPEDPSPAVHAALDGQSTVDEIALRLGLGRFGVLKALATMTAAGAARLATPEELAAAVVKRTADHQEHIARLLALQWAECDAHGPRPLEVLAELGEARQRPAEVVSALTLLGHRHLGSGGAAAAMVAFTQALSQRPGDVPALEGLRAACEAAGDLPQWTSTTLRLANVMLEDDDAKRSAALAGEILARTPGDLGALLVRAKASVRAKDREAVVEVAGTVVGLLGRKATRRIERDTAQYCRDAVAHLAPERSDLLRALRALSETRQTSRRRLALAGALIAVAAGAAVYLWPPSAAALLSRARDAVEAGNRAEALQAIGLLMDTYPESPESEEVAKLQARLTSPTGRSRAAAPVAASASPRPVPAVEREALPSLSATLDALPAAPAVEALKQRLSQAAPPAGKDALSPQEAHALGQAFARCAFQARERLDALASTRNGQERSKADLAALKAVVEAATRAIEPVFAREWSAALPSLAALVDAAKSETVSRAAREADSALKAYAHIAEGTQQDLERCRLRVMELEVEVAHAECREQAPRLLVAGELEAAQRLYANLQERLAALEKEPALARAREAARRNGVIDFLHDRQAMLADVRRGLEAGRAAEAAGNLSAAVAAYDALTKRHYTIRFDRLIRVPVDVESLPAGAHVHVNGEDQGAAPLRVRVPWGVAATISVEAPGYEPLVTVVQRNGQAPLTKIQARLVPRARWSLPLETTGEVWTVEAGEDLLVADRAGHVLWLSGVDGRVRWSRHVKSLEGLRGQPGVAQGAVLLPFVDGRLLTLDSANGEVLGDVQAARALGGVAVLGSVAAVAVASPGVIGMERGRRVFDVALPSAAATPVIAAHGAFWVGTVDGSLIAIDPEHGTGRRIALTGNASAAVTLSATPSGLLLAAADGTLRALGRGGEPRWTSSHLGDLAISPAEAGGLVVVSDRTGRTHLLEAATGAPRSSLLLSKPPVGGFHVLGTRIVATLSDGRLWVLETSDQSVAVDANVCEKGVSEALVTTAGEIVIVARDGRLLVLPLPLPAPDEPPAPEQAGRQAGSTPAAAPATSSQASPPRAPEPAAPPTPSR